MLFALVAGWGFWPNPRQFAGYAVLFILLLLLGWKVFGAPLHS